MTAVNKTKQKVTPAVVTNTKSKSKKKGVELFTPVLDASFVNIVRPDTKYGKYNITVTAPKEGAENQDEIDAFVARLKEINESVPDSASKPVKDGDLKSDFPKTSDENMQHYSGKWIMRFQSLFPVPVYDSKPQRLNIEQDESVAPRPGDSVRVHVLASPYDKGDSAGVSFILKGVQIIKSNGSSWSPFDAYDGGFVVDTDDDSPFDNAVVTTVDEGSPSADF